MTTYDSLVIAGGIELLGGGVASTNPLCLGAMFRLQPGADPGAPQPTTDYVASLILDGERPFGRRASNRQITLPIWITASTRGVVAAAREVLQSLVDEDFWTLVWTRDPSTNASGLAMPLILDCYRALPTKNTFNTLQEKQGYGVQVLVTIPAKPYGRSDTQVQMSFASPAPLPYLPPPAPPSPVVLDDFSSISSTQCVQNSKHIIGPFTACWDPDLDLVGDPGGSVTPFTYSNSYVTPKNLTGCTSLQMYLGLGSRYWAFLEYHGRTSVSIYCTLTDVNGKTLDFSRNHVKLPVSPSFSEPCFSRVTVPIPQVDSTLFDFSHVAKYSLTIVNRQHPVPRFGYCVAYLDALTAQPGSTTASPVTRGAVYTLYGIQGTARTPASFQFQQPPTAGTPTTITATGAATYTVPAGTAWLKVECVGGGGAGADMNVAGVGGGGGGGEYARIDVFACSPGQAIPYAVGKGGASGATPTDGQATVFGPAPGGSQIVTASGGKSALQNSITGGLGGTGSTDPVHFDGGTGRTASGSVGGGGASSGGNSAPGETPMGTSAVYFTTAGSGSWTCPAGVFQVFAECWGGGGSGATGGSLDGAGGGGGEYAAGFVNVTPGTVYHPFVGSGGASPGAGNDLNGSAGTASSFAGDNATITANPGQGGAATWTGGGGNGGSGSAAPTHFSGGKGGSASPYSGSGGSSAGSAAAGNQGNGYGNTTPAPSDGGAGGAGSGASAGTGTAGTQPGGGGGGTYTTAASGAGAPGQVRLTYPGGAPTNNGAAAVPGGGAGGAGGGAADTGGTTGSQPGGGGGGADMSTLPQTAGQGGAGNIVITPFASQPFKTLIAHRPPRGTPKTWQPIVSVGAGADAPDGTHQYTYPQPVSGVNALFSGTYSFYLVNASWNGTGSRTVFITITQTEYSGGPSYTLSTPSITFTPADVTNGLLAVGVLTLPIKKLAPDNTTASFSVSVTDSNTLDRYDDLLALDTQGQTVIINEPSSGYITYYIDAPGPDADLGDHLGTSNGRPSSVSVMDNAKITGPLYLEPADGDNLLMAYSADTQAPNIAASYFPAWWFDRYQ